MENLGGKAWIFPADVSLYDTPAGYEYVTIFLDKITIPLQATTYGANLPTQRFPLTTHSITPPPRLSCA
ncbi:MAG TPA: hypothetical protein VFF21_05725 [Flavobacteriaceae bacterium]|nr:hypothetical protein [Flavobacteriaceae bacterium]